MAARASLDRAMEATRGFDGASRRDGRGAGRQPGGGSANAELVPALATLRNRSRELVRNNGYMKHALNVLVHNAIGTTGIVPKFKSKRARKLWRTFSVECDAAGLLNLAGIEAQLARAMWESGEVLLRFRYRRPSDGLAVPLQLQVLEADHLDTSKMGPVDGGFCVAGVQFDLIGRRTGYWLFDQHPGEVATVPKNWVSRFVPARDVIHLFRAIDRPGQVRGLPHFAVSILRTRDLHEYQEAELVRKKIEACFAAFVKIEGDGFTGGVGAGGIKQQGGGARLEGIQPGSINYLRNGEEVQFSSPAASEGYEEHIRAELRAIAAGADITYEQLTGDYSQVNFTSGRMGKIEFKAMVEQFQWLIFVPMVMQRIVDRFCDIAAVTGQLPADTAPDEWTAPRIPLLDPLREAEAYAVMVENRFIPRHEVVRELGYDPAVVDNEIQADPLAISKQASTPGDPTDPNAEGDQEAEDGAGDNKNPDKSGKSADDKAAKRSRRRALLHDHQPMPER